MLEIVTNTLIVSLLVSIPFLALSFKVPENIEEPKEPEVEELKEDEIELDEFTEINSPNPLTKHVSLLASKVNMLDRLNKDLQIANELWSEEYEKLYEEKQQLVAERNNVNRMMYTLSIVSIILVPIYSSVIYVTLLRR
jgi:hypothetical protein